MQKTIVEPFGAKAVGDLARRANKVFKTIGEENVARTPSEKTKLAETVRTVQFGR